MSIVKESNGAYYFGCVEPTPGLVELALALHVEHEVAARAILHSEEQVALRLWLAWELARNSFEMGVRAYLGFEGAKELADERVEVA